MRPLLIILSLLLAGCGAPPGDSAVPVLRWYVPHEGSGVFHTAAQRCGEASGRYRIEIAPLPADADQQREQLVRRLAARDPDIDILGMDVIWTAEFAEAGWILPWEGAAAQSARAGRLAAPLESATYRGRLWGAPLNTNAQLLWYRKDLVSAPPGTWEEMIAAAEALGATVQAQGERYEGLVVLYASLLASAGGDTVRALEVMQRFARSSAADPGLATSREDQARIAFERGDSAFMLNYPFVWASARRNDPALAARMGWARWPAVVPGRPSRVTVGGLNLGVSAHSRYPQLAFEAAACLASPENQRLAAERAALPPSIEALYDEPAVRAVLPFAPLLRETLRDAVQRPQTPFYSDVSLAVSRTLHPMHEIRPREDAALLRQRIERALRSEGLL